MAPMVYIVGVGPGDPQLLTLKAKRIIEAADCLVFDRLIHPSILDGAKKGAIFVDVGKFPDFHPVPQDAINDVLKDMALKNGIVARIKGGDPFVFGRGGEEAEFLRQHQIPFEIVPGISSSISAPAYAGIPVTHRDFASSFHVFTGNSKNNTVDLDFQTLARLSGTLIFLMGVKSLETITNQLIAHGKSKGTPCAVIESGTLPSQRVITGMLSEIALLAKAQQIVSPAITVIGEVAALRDKLAWFCPGVLAGKTILITRPVHQAKEISGRLTEMGATLLHLPTIEIEPSSSPEQIRQVFDHLKSYDWVVFTSVNGVEYFFKDLYARQIDVRAISHLKFAVIGTKTGEQLSKFGIFADLMPKSYTTNALAESIIEHIPTRAHILLARSDLGSKDLSDALTKHGYSFTDLPIYTTKILGTPEISEQKENGEDGMPNPSVQLRSWLERVDIIPFTSSSAVHGFVNLLGKDHLHLLSHLLLYSIGPATSAALQHFGLEMKAEAKIHTIDGLIEAICSTIDSNMEHDFKFT